MAGVDAVVGGGHGTFSSAGTFSIYVTKVRRDCCVKLIKCASITDPIILYYSHACM